MKASEFLKQFEKRQQNQESDDKEEEKDHSLQAQSRERADHPNGLHTGTAYDWEDLERYQRELDRLDREGPGKPKH
jgi:hypothetical protein